MNDRATPTFTPIGVVRNEVREGLDEGWGAVRSELRLDSAWAGALHGLEAFSHVWVLFWMHDSHMPEAPQRRPRDRQDMPLLGLLAQRAKHRPNAIGITAVEILEVGEELLVVQGLDAIDGTPILDIKPYMSVFDRPAEVREPEWAQRLMEGYF